MREYKIEGRHLKITEGESWWSIKDIDPLIRTLVAEFNEQDARIKELVAECEKKFFNDKGDDDVNTKRMQMYIDAYNKNSVDPRATANEAVEAFDKVFGTGGVS